VLRIKQTYAWRSMINMLSAQPLCWRSTRRSERTARNCKSLWWFDKRHLTAVVWACSGCCYQRSRRRWTPSLHAKICALGLLLVHSFTFDLCACLRLSRPAESCANRAAGADSRLTSVPNTDHHRHECVFQRYVAHTLSSPSLSCIVQSCNFSRPGR